jgi:hypothetical protein
MQLHHRIPPVQSRSGYAAVLAGVVALFGASCAQADSATSARPVSEWVHLSSKDGQLPVPNGGSQQTASLVVDIDRDGADNFVITERTQAPAVVWYRRSGNDWEKYVIEGAHLRIEAGGVAHDIDGDGDMDIVFGGDSQSNQVWWWENPYPDLDPARPWKRHLIKDSGANQHHDQIFADIKGTGKPQLIFWNQRAKTVFLAEVPEDPRNSGPWELEIVYQGEAGEGAEGAAAYAEGLDAFDVDGDGRVDLLAGNYWFKYLGDGQFQPTRIGTIGGRIRAGQFKPGRFPQVVIAPGDGSGPLRLYEAEGDPTVASSWVGRTLLDRDMVHGHTLEIGDINGDGHLDIFAAEMAKWTREPTPADHPDATAWILYGDGRGGFETTILKLGHGWHEGRLGDFNGDGNLDVLNKPYTWDAPRVDLWLNNGVRAAAGGDSRSN